MSATDAKSDLRLLTEIDFSLGGNGEDFRLTGFSHPEVGHRWGLSPSSSITFRPFENTAALFVLFEIEPFTPFAGYEGLDLWIFIDAEVRQVLKLASRLVVSIGIEARDKIESGFTINFRCFDAAQPKDYMTDEVRPLAFRLGKLSIYGSAYINRAASRFGDRISGSDIADISASVARQTHMSPAELALLFESLGDFCDFGFFQRRLGVEPLSLFRFSAIQIQDLARGILNDFEGLAENFDVHYREDLHEYRITEHRFRITSHTHVRVGELGKEEIIERERRRLLFLKRKFMEDVRLGGKIFLVRKPPADNERDIQTLWLALNLHTKNHLLLVKQTPVWTPGLCVMAPGIFEGEVSGDIGQTQPNDESWLKLLGNAFLCSEGR